MTAGVERAHGQGDETHERQVGEHDAREIDRELELTRNRSETRCEQPDDGFRQEHREPRDHRGEARKGHDRLSEEAFARRLPPNGLNLAENRQKCDGEGALGHQRPEGVGDGERHQVGVARGGGAKHVRKDRVAEEPAKPAQKRKRADRSGAPGDGRLGRTVDSHLGVCYLARPWSDAVSARPIAASIHTEMPAWLRQDGYLPEQFIRRCPLGFAKTVTSPSNSS
ncbi:MAG: hypothetical protein AAFX94_13620, partial [Myxococcota bacterium]